MFYFDFVEILSRLGKVQASFLRPFGSKRQSRADFALAAQNFNIWNYFDTKLAKSLEGCEIMSTFAVAIPGKHKAVGGWPK